MDGTIAASRYQFPLKLGYATTVDKAQGCTIASLVVDCYNLWKFAQMSVGIGRAVCIDGLEIQNFNLNAATLKHPDIVMQYDSTPSIGVQGTKLFCTTCIERVNANPGPIGVHAFISRFQAMYQISRNHLRMM